MISDPQGTVMALFLAFCRIGACLMVMPGFSSARLPMQIRLLLAMALSMAILPLLWDTIYPLVKTDTITYLKFIFFESLVGATFGMIAHLYVLGMQFAATAIGTAISFTGPPVQDALEDTSENQLSSMLSYGVLLLLFILDFHHVVFRAIVDSYASIPLGGAMSVQRMLISLTDTLVASMNIALRVASPFILYGFLFNVAIGLINKLAPQIPVYFISTPYALGGGLLLLYFGIAALVNQFASGFFRVFANM
ncbi:MULTISPECIES: flagellar biosynthetic protein FliR [Agrobacterium]|uniref:Flagellar biosynthetic protein FliR n=2 Tax=Pseudomonadota TaxID=1224 RepID=A0A1R3TQT6_9HYPH|nr:MULTISPECIES: flagellar biosynthetic protein FliR [Agrobacterium]KAA3514080.1 flagellar type III secretion system protein FliR [Agrobacterium rosae]KAA3522748.1 flagellar type III secretion system protein FliR [Agrobacterium rosae]MBN7807340.1 flagellar type III secretion system protein FliR [Agrobacterium rosae]MCM2433991.1 flagellar type III secretion system protein FliR [Agrobacterium rosae]MDX8314354.1 flagellar biosynthetic protein FliR [Agrobacterium rosae]